MSSGNQPSQLKRKTRLVQHRKEYNEGEDEDEWMPIDDDEENDDFVDSKKNKTKPNPAKKSKKDESVSSVAKYMNSLQTQSNLKLALVSFFCLILIKQAFYEIYFKEIRESEIRILEKTQHFDLCMHNLRAAFKLNPLSKFLFDYFLILPF